MAQNNLIKFIIIVAPSGTGKSSLIKKLKMDVPDLVWSVSTTTRKPRPGEVEGVDYFYIETTQFKRMIEQDQFIEWALVHGNYYGTSKHLVEEGLHKKQMYLFDLDVQGTDNMLKHYREYCKAIFIAPPSLEELEKRLRQRATEDEATLQKRLLNAKQEIRRKNDYDYLVLNDDFDRAYQDLLMVIKEIKQLRNN